MEEQIRQTNPTLHRYLFTVTTFSKLLALSLFIILPFSGFYLGMQYQQKVSVNTSVVSGVKKNTVSSLTLKNSPSPPSSPTTDTNKYYAINSNLALSMPPDAIISNGTVSFSGTQYGIVVNFEAGLCPNNTYGDTCGYTDESLTNIPTFRIWKDTNGVFALNPQSIQISHHYLNSLVITKVTPNKVFTNNEILSWKKILTNWKVTN